ncbi:hypothetical protein SSS_10917 [Sarcoptes scabiei]|uniref:MBD domain-containing protein n=1 Tax=Sarcoptes scabiei TaxID=52283 RepID=A0A834VAL5_SARSC|nr:hypothetical protein SSS_10917 [Sarcoptes scabiei]
MMSSECEFKNQDNLVNHQVTINNPIESSDVLKIENIEERTDDVNRDSKVEKGSNMICLNKGDLSSENVSDSSSLEAESATFNDDIADDDDEIEDEDEETTAQPLSHLSSERNSSKNLYEANSGSTGTFRIDHLQQSSNASNEINSSKTDSIHGEKYADMEIVSKNCDELGVYKWKEFQSMKVKTFTIDEYQRFRVPFGIGWKRELVLRCTGSTADKKAGDVYYHAPNGACKLRSNVEMNQYLKRHPQITNLTIDNFTFAKQPIYRPPDEIILMAQMPTLMVYWVEEKEKESCPLGHTPKSVSSERRKVLPVQPIHSGGIEMKSENDEKEYIASNSSFKEDYADKDRSLKMKIVKQSNGNRRIDTNSNEDFHSNETKAKKIPIILKNHPSMKALSLN